MRTVVLASIAAGLGMAGVAGAGMWRLDHPAGTRAVADFSRPQPVPRTLAPVETAQQAQLQQQLARLTDGHVVLDMRALETLDAAVTLVAAWRDKHPAQAHLVCWLAAADDQALVTAVMALSETGCSVLRVALVEVTPSTD